MKRLLISLFITILIGLCTIFIYDKLFKEKTMEIVEKEDISYIFDISYAKQIEANELNKIINSDDEIILLIGDKNDNATAKMTTFLKEVIKDYHLKTYYLERKNINNELEEIELADSNLKEILNFNPLLLVFKKGILFNVYPGGANYINIINFLKYCELEGMEENE